MINFVFREPTGVLDSPFGYESVRMEKVIRSGGAKAIEARWYYGHRMLRFSPELASEYVEALVARGGISERVIRDRMRFAELYPTREALANALANHPSWREIKKSFSARRDS